jgi:hypothetical protein
LFVASSGSSSSEQKAGPGANFRNHFSAIESAWWTNPFYQNIAIDNFSTAHRKLQAR